MDDVVTGVNVDDAVTGVNARRIGDAGVDVGRLRMNADLDVTGRVITNGWCALSLKTSNKHNFFYKNDINNIEIISSRVENTGRSTGEGAQPCRDIQQSHAITFKKCEQER